MQIFVPKESCTGETRISMIPASVEKLVKLGANVEVESELGNSIGFLDSDYTKTGSTISTDRPRSLSTADMVLRLRKPPQDEIKLLKKGAIHVSFLDPFNERDLILAFKDAEASSISMELIPRTTLAQKMDALSSQANLAGYVAVVLAASRLDKAFPMMMTPSGTLTPAQVFIVGAGVAGLQAIATARRLGARVEAFDTRPVVEEQVKSLGAKFVKIDLGETGQTKDGYAKALTEEQIQKQRDAMRMICANSSVVITTAQVFGKKAPRIITTEMVMAMKPGSVIVDMAAESGGNVECSKADEEVVVHGVKVIGFSNLPGRVAAHASQMYSNNLYNLVEHFWNKNTKSFELKLEDEIIKGCLVTHQGKIWNERLKDFFAQLVKQV